MLFQVHGSPAELWDTGLAYEGEQLMARCLAECTAVKGPQGPGDRARLSALHALCALGTTHPKLFAGVWMLTYLCTAVYADAQRDTHTNRCVDAHILMHSCMQMHEDTHTHTHTNTNTWSCLLMGSGAHTSAHTACCLQVVGGGCRQAQPSCLQVTGHQLHKLQA